MRPHSRKRRLGVVAALTALFTLVAAPAAVADEKGWWCHIPAVCEAKEAVDFVSDPLGYVQQELADANVWFLGKLLDLLTATTAVDLTDPAFLRQYALIFAASTFLTVALWLAAVAKRALRGVPLGTALGEAVGFLVLQFVVNALTPGAVALLMQAVDEVTEAFVPGATGNMRPFLSSLIKQLAARPDTGAMALIAVNLLMMLGALLMWIELLVRSAAVYTAVALGPLVNAGLVDKDLWGRTRKWAGALFALALSKPVLFALLGLGGAVMNAPAKTAAEDPASQILSGALLLFLAVFASAVLYKWVPVFGDEMASLHHARRSAASAGPAAAVDGPAAHVNRAMGHHVQDSLVGGSRAVAVKPASATSGASAGAGASAVAGPLAAAGAVFKAGTDVAKHKATTSPGAQNTPTTPPDKDQ